MTADIGNTATLAAVIDRRYKSISVWPAEELAGIDVPR
jgi:hypothetical protein